jgi:hypothetical protein
MRLGCGPFFSFATPAWLTLSLRDLDICQDNASARSFLEDVAPSTPHIETLALSFIVVMRCGAFDA